jgi:acyl-CoA thioesterase
MTDPDEFFSRDTFAQHSGIKCMSVGPGTARVSMEIGDRHRNSHGTVHGGALFTLADAAFALASNSEGVPAAAINATITYMKAAREGALYAEAEEFSKNPKLATYIVTITDSNGERIALFQGMVYRKQVREGKGL